MHARLALRGAGLTTLTVDSRFGPGWARFEPGSRRRYHIDATASAATGGRAAAGSGGAGARAWLGLVSYSVYLGLPLMLDLYDDIPFPRSYQHLPWLQAGASVVFLSALLAFAAMSYYLVEAPFQRLGRRLTMRLEPGFATARSEPLGAKPGRAPSAGTRYAAGPSRDRPRQLATRHRANSRQRLAFGLAGKTILPKRDLLTRRLAARQ